VEFQSGRIDRQQLMRRSLPIRKAFLDLGERWWDCESRKVANMSNALGANFQSPFCFIDHKGVEPTNNSAEQALRRAVQCRKISFGNRSDAGAVATARHSRTDLLPAPSIHARLLDLRCAAPSLRPQAPLAPQ
jgi:Transposase IS66 family